MRLIPPILVSLLLAAAQTWAQEPAAENLVAIHSPGANWETRADHVQAVQEHRKIYEELARNGDILFGGRFQGEPVLGMSVFRSGIAREEISNRLRLDPSVVAGVIKLEFRVWQTQLGKLPDPIVPQGPRDSRPDAAGEPMKDGT